MAWDKLSTYKTKITLNPYGLSTVEYRDTLIVLWTDEFVQLISGGYETVTTKRKMNQASHQFGLGYSVYQRKWEWRVCLPDGSDVLFKDGMKFRRNKAKDTYGIPKEFYV